MAADRRQFTLQQSVSYVFQDPWGSFFTNILCAALMGLLLFPVTNNRHFFYWTSAIFLVATGRTVLGLLYHHQNQTETPLAHWYYAYAAATLLMAMVWGTSGLFFFPEQLSYQFCLVAVLAGLVVGAGHSQAPFRGLNALYTVIIMAPVMVQFFLSGRFGNLNYAFALVLLLTALAINNRKINRIVHSSFDLRYKINHMAITDPLTGLANRRRFREVLDLECARVRRHQNQVSLLMIDVDHFKRYNDIYGHPAGDRCLEKIAAAIQGTVHRPADIIARYGGEEFAVILPDTPREGALAVAEKIRQQIQALAISHQGEAIQSIITASVGVATSGNPVYSCSDALISAADQALYEAKKAGRNRVSIYSH